MHALIVTAGSHGDVHPFIAVGRELASRGTRVTVMVNEYFRGLVEEAGLSFRPLGEPFDLRRLSELPDVMDHRRGPAVVMERLLLPSLASAYQGVLELALTDRPNVVVHHHICAGAAWAAQAAGLRLVTACLAPFAWMNPRDTLVMQPWSPSVPPGWFRWITRKAVPPALRWYWDRPLNRGRAGMGLGPARDIYLDVTRGGDLNLALWSPVLRGRLEGDPPQAAITGFPWHDRHAEQEHPPHELEAFLDDCERSGGPPVLFSLGTAAVHVAGRFYDDAAEACRRTGRRGLLLVGRSGVRPARVPAGTRVFTYAPFSSVMPRCAASVHHGGIGTTAQALRAGRPQVIVPHAHDQFDNAARCERLSVGVRLNRTRLNSRSLALALETALGSEPLRRAASQAGERVAREDGARVAADRIAALAR